MKLIHNFVCKFVAGFYEELRGLYSTDFLYNPINVVAYDMKAQKWERKIKR
mgnify:CR=1 FL=1